MLVIKVAFPTFEITRCNDFAWLPCFFTSCWYLLMRNTALGTPITIINGGIKADKTVISYPKRPIKPKAQVTPIPTTSKVMNVALNERKKKKKIMAVISKAPTTKIPISSVIFCEFKVLIYGIPEMRTSTLCFFSKDSTVGINTSITKSLRTGVLTMSLFRYIAVCKTPLSLYNKLL